MKSGVFDAAGFVDFDLSKGTISSADASGLALVPPEVLATLTPGSQLDDAARSWGAEHGKRLATTLKNANDDGIEALAEHLCGTIAALGMGRLAVEIHGDALLFRGTSPAGQGSEGSVTLLGGFIAGYLGTLVPRTFTVVPLESKDDKHLLWAGNPDAAEKIKGSIGEGLDPLAAVGKLSEGS